jgi:uncharacterized protein (DUF952 family)
VTLIFKVVHEQEWRDAESAGLFHGSAKDRADGFLHFSTAQQLGGTLDRYYAGADDLLLVAVDTGALGTALRFEPSRDGALFPHLYGDLALAAVHWTRPLLRDAAGSFVLPAEARATP